MLSSTQKRTSKPIIRGVETGFAAALVVGTAFTLDHFFGAHETATRRTNPEFYTARQGARHTLGVLPGCQSDGRLFLEKLRPFAPDTTLVGVDYPKHGFDQEAVCEGLAKQLIAARAERPSLLCQSMGGMVMRHFMEYAEATGVAEKLGGFGAIVLDSSPFDGHDIRKSYRLLLEAASVGRTSWAADHIKRLINRPDTPLDTIHGQGSFMNAQHPDGPLPDIMDAVYYIQGPHDHVINTPQAAQKYANISPLGKFQVITDLSRPEHSHTADVAHYGFELRFAGIQPPEYTAA